VTDESRSWFNRNVMALGVIIVAVVASAYIYLNTPPEREYETYSRFGLSFEYPEGMEIWEQGMGGVGIATTTAGIVQGTLVEDEVPEIVGVLWIPSESMPPLEDVLDMAFSQLGEGSVVESRGDLVSTLKGDSEMLRQDFIMSEGGTPISGIVGAWYDPIAERTYLNFYLTLPDAVSDRSLLKRFDRLVSSFESRFEAFPETSLPAYWPTEGWKTAAPEEVGIDSEMLAEVSGIIQEGELGVDSLLVVRDGYLVMDEYYGEFSRGERHNIYSCTKSVVSTLIGIAIEEGYVEGLNQTLLDFFPDRTPQNMSAWKEEITLENLLTMTAGFDARDSWLYEWECLGKMRESPDALQYVLDLGVIEEPGTRFEYTNGVSHLLSCIINETTGMSTLGYAFDSLFTPLGIDDVEWKNDSLGKNWGYSSLYLTPHDMAKFGHLFLNNGTWDGEQIVPEAWVGEATRKHVDAPLWPGYGYQWWVDEWGFYLALGYGGQLIFVVPEDDLVVVFTGSDDEVPQFADGLLRQWILPAVSIEPPPLPTTG
jgi:CubicO group peptidase (beta-lactamase class C family)